MQAVLLFAIGQLFAYALYSLLGGSYLGLLPSANGDVPLMAAQAALAFANLALVANLYMFYTNVVRRMVSEPPRGRMYSVLFSLLLVFVLWPSFVFPRLWVVFIGIVALLVFLKNRGLEKTLRGENDGLADQFNLWGKYALVYALSAIAAGLIVYFLLAIDPDAIIDGSTVRFIVELRARDAVRYFQVAASAIVWVFVTVYYLKNMLITFDEEKLQKIMEGQSESK